MDVIVGGRSVFDRIGGRGGNCHSNKRTKNEAGVVCKYWLAGNCHRNPCKFLHAHQKPPVPPHNHSNMSWRNPNYRAPQSGQVANDQVSVRVVKSNQPPQLCKYWSTDNCVHGDNCKNLHSWFVGEGITMVARLQGGHTKPVTGIALAPASDKLYSVSSDKSMRIWDCHSGQCSGTVNFDGECGSLITEGPYVFVGLPGAVKAWNIQAQSEATLNCCNRAAVQVHTMVVGNDMLFAGLHDGTILCWKTGSPEEVPAVLKAHTGAVLSIIVGAKSTRLYSGSADKTIKVWDLGTLQCLQTLDGHSGAVMSLLCWDSYLLSGSLDDKIKVWAAKDMTGELELVYERNEGYGVLALCGIHDAEGKPVLLCSSNDNSVRLYDLPAFTERGRLFAKKEVRALQIGMEGLFFTGDATGQVTVWKLTGSASAVATPL